MEERTYEAIRTWPREVLEAFAVRAALHLREHHTEGDTNQVFVVALAGFLAGALVATAGFALGVSLG